MKFIIIIYKFCKKVVLAIFNFLKAQFNFVKNVFKTQGFKGILLLFINLILAFFGGLAYEKTHSKKSRGGRTDNTSVGGRIRQHSDIRRRRNINDNPDECRLRGAEEGWEDRNSKRDISDNMREPSEAGKVSSSANTKGKRDNTYHTEKPETQKQKNSEWDIDPQRRIKN